MHDDDVLLGPFEPLGGEAEELEVLPDRRERHPALPLELDAQHHDDVGIADRLRQAVGDLDAHALDLRGHHGARSADHDRGAHLGQQMDVRAHHAAVLDVAEDRDAQAVEAALVAADREGIEQRLRRMLVRAVAGVDDSRREPLRQHVRRAGAGVADDDQVRRHGLEVQRRVDQASRPSPRPSPRSRN